jgi:hypothetical protein
MNIFGYFRFLADTPGFFAEKGGMGGLKQRLPR